MAKPVSALVSSSPIGIAFEEESSRRAARNPAYREQQTERAGYREVAWLLIKYRMDKGLSQQQLSEMVGTSHSQISRIESGRHRTNLDTLQRIAKALDLTVVIGFEGKDQHGPTKRDLVTL
jgi:ribosome-binding protein aMBF1 (putative translation factor)